MVTLVRSPSTNQSSPSRYVPNAQIRHNIVKLIFENGLSPSPSITNGTLHIVKRMTTVPTTGDVESRTRIRVVGSWCVTGLQLKCCVTEQGLHPDCMVNHTCVRCDFSASDLNECFLLDSVTSVYRSMIDQVIKVHNGYLPHSGRYKAL